METRRTSRIEAFSDGVFAIAITLLVLDLKVPAEPPLLDGLLAQWPVYAAYLISFTFILIMWVNHHWMFEHIARVDSRLMLWNGLQRLVHLDRDLFQQAVAICLRQWAFDAP
jgi:uncharacterized membrane protein